jgi:hypothetical protein
MGTDSPRIPVPFHFYQRRRAVMTRTLLRNRRGRLSESPSPQRRRRFEPALESLESRLTPTISFASPQTFAVGNLPSAVAVGDFNGDGRPDLVVANVNSNFLSVLLNTTPVGSSTPTFGVQQTFATDAAVHAVAVADFNGDGRPDIVASHDGDVLVFLNTTPIGSSVLSFAPAKTFAVGTRANAVVVGDFNGDGRPDIATANNGDGTVSVLMNTTPVGAAAAASFTPQQTFAVGLDPGGIVAADFNGDGRADLAVNSQAARVSILMNTTPVGAAAASFATQQTFNTLLGFNLLMSADFNGDSRPDLAVTSGSSDVVVILNTTPAGAATASFSTPQDFVVGSNPDVIAGGDFSGDGRPDLVDVNADSNTVSVLQNTTVAGAATVSFAAQQTFAVGASPAGLAVGDFNGDGRPDLAVASASGNNVSVFANTTTPFSSTEPTLVGQFGTIGVREFIATLHAWQQLTPANATHLAADPLGDVVAEFPGYGVWEFHPASGWKLLNGVDASLLSINAQGIIVAEFPGYGVGEFVPASGWRTLTPANASQLALDALGDVAADFPGYGVQLFRPSVGWKQINGVDVNLLQMDPQGDIVANFPGYGVGEFRATGGWALLNGTQASAVAIDGRGDVEAVFQGYGTAIYTRTNGWQTLSTASAAVLGVDALGNLFGDFTGYGVMEYEGFRGWFVLNPIDASILAVG